MIQCRLQSRRERRVGDIRERRRARRATRIERCARRRPGRIHLVVCVDCQICIDRIRRRIKGRIAARRLRKTHEAVLAVVEVLREVERKRCIGCIRRGRRTLPEQHGRIIARRSAVDDAELHHLMVGQYELVADFRRELVNRPRVGRKVRRKLRAQIHCRQGTARIFSDGIERVVGLADCRRVQGCRNCKVRNPRRRIFRYRAV